MSNEKRVRLLRRKKDGADESAPYKELKTVLDEGEIIWI